MTAFIAFTLVLAGASTGLTVYAGAGMHTYKALLAEGPVIAPLFLGPEKPGDFSVTLASGTISSKDPAGPLAGKSIDDLVALIKSGDVYVNVHTAARPAGEIKGTVKE